MLQNSVDQSLMHYYKLRQSMINEISTNNNHIKIVKSVADESKSYLISGNTVNELSGSGNGIKISQLFKASQIGITGGIYLEDVQMFGEGSD